MEYFLAFVLTTLGFWSIIKLNAKRYRKNIKSVVYTQSTIHNMIKDFLPNTSKSRRDMTQLERHVSKNMIKIIVLDGKAYWVSDNQFYTADIKNGSVVSETVRTVDTTTMSKEDLDKMLHILDNLNSGGQDDSSSTGNI